MISLGCLIYRSTVYADAVWQSAHRYTPHLHDGRARFFFVANDATELVLEHLWLRKYPHVVQNNPKRTDAELRAMGYAPPEYLHRVYRGWNRLVQESEERLVLVQSDLMFSPGWLEALERHDVRDKVVSPQLIERRHPKHGTFPGAIERDFGSNPGNFREKDFLEYVERIRPKGRQIQMGGAYAPAYALRSNLIRAGLYPEGNLKRPDSDKVLRYGDRDLFARLAKRGIGHITATDSLVYHFKEGEMSE